MIKLLEDEYGFINGVYFEELGATEDAFRIIKSLSPKRGKLKNFTDVNGNNMWHYLSVSDDPVKNYSVWKNKLKDVNYNKLNNKHMHFIHYLYANGNVSAINFFKEELPNIECEENENSLFLSLWSQNYELITQELEEKHIYIDIQDENGFTPLIIATGLLNEKTMEVLLDAGADPNIQDNSGKTALHHSIELGDINKYNILENAYANDRIKNNFGKTPADLINIMETREEKEFERIKRKWINNAEKIKNL